VSSSKGESHGTSSCRTEMTNWSLPEVDACFAGMHFRVKDTPFGTCAPLCEAFPISKLAAILDQSSDATAFVSDSAGISLGLNHAIKDSIPLLLLSSKTSSDGNLNGHTNSYQRLAADAEKHGTKLSDVQIAASTQKFRNLAERAIIEFYLLSLAHVVIQTAPTSFAYSSQERGSVLGQKSYHLYLGKWGGILKYSKNGPAEICTAFGAGAIGKATCSCAESKELNEQA